jgi:hypothetical protein
MPPINTNIHIDVFLTDHAAGYTNEDYVALQVLPIITSVKETGKIAAYGTEHYRLDFDARAMGGAPARIDWATGTPISFSAKEWTIEDPVDDRQAAIYDDPFDAYRDGTDTVMEKLLLKREDLVATLMSTSGNFGGTTAGTAWGTPGTGTPVTDIRKAMRAIVARSGRSRRNMYVVMSDFLWDRMIQTTEFKTLYLNTVPGAAAPGNVTPQTAATAIGLGGIIVGPAVKLTSKEGVADVMADVWSSTTVAVFVKSARPTLKNPGYGGIISPNVPGFPSTATVAIDRYREERIKSWVIRGTALYDQIAVNKAMGQLITGIS